MRLARCRARTRWLYRRADGHAVALKELQFAAAPDAAQVDAFEREAATLKTLSNAAIPRFIPRDSLFRPFARLSI